MTSWSSLPDDVKSEVTKFTDFQTSHHLGLCCTEDYKFVNSLKTKISFLKIQISEKFFALLIIDSPSEILRIDLKQRRIESEFVIFRSDCLKCPTYGRRISETTLKNEISNILNGIFQRKLEIESCSIESNTDETEIIQLIGRRILEIKPKRIIVSGEFYSEFLKTIDSLRKSSEIIIRNWTKDTSKDWNDYKFHGFKAFEVSKWRSRNGAQEHIKATVGICLISYLGHIESDPQKRIHWIPGLNVADPERIFLGSGTNFEKLPNQVYKISMDSRKFAFLKFSECGVSIQVCDLKSVDLTDRTCGLEWMCPSCSPKTMDNWFFREIIGKLH